MRIPENNVLRTALVPRVSTDEQVRHGDSLDAQEDALVRFANENNMKIVGIYRDEGCSARKPVLKRPVMLKLLEDVKAGKIDRILFTKLDRWFRNVGEYHSIQTILERHNVTWQAILEDYNTATADGRLKVNIMLSVAENEADRTSERIKFVFNAKLAKKEVYFPLPTGYTTEMIDGVRRAVKDPEKQDMMEYFFKRALTTSIRQASEDVKDKYGVYHAYSFWWQLTRKEIYTGTYKGIDDFAPAYITKEEYNELTNAGKVIKKTQNDRVYIFSGLIKCPYCGRRLAGKTNKGSDKREYVFYRCGRSISGACNYKQVSEKKTEKYLLENLRTQLESYVLSADAAQSKEKKGKPKKSEIEKLQERLRRLNVAFFDGNMTDDEYAEQTKVIKEKISKVQVEEAKVEKQVDTEAVKAFLATNFEDTYVTLTKKERQQFWRSIIDEVVFDGIEPVRIVFKA